MESTKTLTAEIIKEEQVQKPNYELAKVDENKFIALQGCEEDLRKIVEQNPFIEVTDKASLKLAKEREANLRNARLGLRTSGKSESQEKTLLGMLKKAGEFVKGTIDYLVLIPEIPENKQHEAIKAFEDKEAIEKERLATEAKERADGIKAEIEEVNILLGKTIEEMEFATIEETERKFVEHAKVDKSKFFEFDFMFEEILEARTEELQVKTESLRSEEKTRVDNLKKDQEAKINTLIIEAQEAIEVYVKAPEQKGIKEHVEEIFGIEFDFGEHIEKFNEEKEKYINKAIAREEFVIAEIIKNEKYRIFELGEGLLDLVFQMTVENFVTTKEEIEEALSQSCLEDVKKEFDKMKERVEKAFAEKTETLNEGLEKKKKEGIRLQAEKDKTIDARIKLLEKVGLICQNGVWCGLGAHSYNRQMIAEMSEEEIKEICNDMKQKKGYAEKEALRQKKIKKDKAKMLDLFLSLKDSIDLNQVKFENKEMEQLYKDLTKGLKAVFVELENTINEY